MNKKLDIMPHNEDNQRHGLWETYYDGTPSYKGNYINGKPQGYWVWGNDIRKTFYLI